MTQTPRVEAEQALRDAVAQASAAGHAPDAQGRWPAAAIDLFDDRRLLLEDTGDGTFRPEPLDYWDDYTFHRSLGYETDPENY